MDKNKAIELLKTYLDIQIPADTPISIGSYSNMAEKRAKVVEKTLVALESEPAVEPSELIEKYKGWFDIVEHYGAPDENWPKIMSELFIIIDSQAATIKSQAEEIKDLKRALK